jgi:hypothetical protein
LKTPTERASFWPLETPMADYDAIARWTESAKGWKK